MKHVLTFFAVAAVLAAGLPSRADDSYQVSKTDLAVAVGSRGTASVTISAKKGWHLNDEAPLTLKLGTTPGLETEKAKLARSDLALSNPTQARFDVAVTALEPGRRSLEAEAGFVLCQESACRPVKEKIAISVDASAAAKAEPAKKKTRKK
jgi:hypothetical protein